MTPDPRLAILFHALGGLGAASFYVLFLRVRKWAWESYWLTGGLMIWLILPWIVAAIVIPNLGEVLRSIPPAAFWAAVVFGVGWGIGNMAFGLSIRYLGFAGGYSVTLGLIIVFGTLAPAMIKSAWPDLVPSLAAQETFGQMLSTTAGKVTTATMFVMLVGVVLCGLAGRQKDRELPDDAKQSAVHEFNFFKGILVALISGIGSVGIGLALTSSDPIEQLALAYGAKKEWSSSLTMAIVLTSGGLANIAWCVAMNLRYGTARDYVNTQAPLARNYIFCFLAGTVAYSEFFFYGLATPHMGTLSYTNLPVHVALCVVLGSIWGIVFGEWKGTSRFTRTLIASGILLLLVASGLMAWGGSLAETSETKSTESLAPTPFTQHFV